MAKKISIDFDGQYLTAFIKRMQQHELNMDELMKLPTSEQKGKLIAKEMNNFCFSRDVFFHQMLDMSFGEMKKITNKSWKFKKNG